MTTAALFTVAPVAAADTGILVCKTDMTTLDNAVPVRNWDSINAVVDIMSKCNTTEAMPTGLDIAFKAVDKQFGYTVYRGGNDVYIVAERLDS
jgi:hypothetical protein